MRRLVTLPVLTGLAAAGLLAGTISAASAASAPAPDCDSYSSTFYCDASSPVNPVTWTQKITVDGSTFTSTFSASPFLHGNCEVGARYSYSFSYVSSGVTYTSPATSFLCNKNAPE